MATTDFNAATAVKGYRLFNAVECGRYGVRGLRVVASSNPNASDTKCAFGRDYPTYPPKKYFDICDDVEFSKTWNDDGLGQKVIDTVGAFLRSAGLKCLLRGKLRVVRMGFSDDEAIHPITILISIAKNAQNFPSDAEALSLLHSLMDILGGYRTADNVHIDICRLNYQDSPRKSVSQYLTGTLPSFYIRGMPPYLGSSIGSKESSGTLTAYVQHIAEGSATCYALTCYHSVAASSHNTSNLDSPSIPPVEVHVPAPVDTNETLYHLKENVELYDEEKDKESLKLVQAYNSSIGVVRYTGQNPRGCADWALVELRQEISANQVKELNQHLPYSRDEHGRDFDQWVNVKYEDAFRRGAAKYFQNGPTLKAARKGPLTIGEYFMKVPSRGSRGWVRCRWNSIQETTFHIDDLIQHIESRLNFVNGINETAEVSGKDSGGLILDYEYQPVAMVCCHHGEADAASRALTSASSIQGIFQDIEKTMGWEEGSVSFC